MENSRLFAAVAASFQDCSDMHCFRGVHNMYVFHYISRGSGWLEAGGREYKLKKGCVFLIHPNEPVYYHPDPDDPYSYKWVDFTGGLVKTLLNTTSFGDGEYVTPPLPELEADFDRLISKKEPLLSCNPLLLELFSHLIAAFPAKRQLPLQQNLALTAREYIFANLNKPTLRVQDAADHIGVSRSCLYRMFVKQFGISPMQLIIDERVNNAKRLLESGELVKNTAVSCGFEDPLYFSLAFKRRCGMSPESYRMKNIAKK